MSMWRNVANKWVLVCIICWMPVYAIGWLLGRFWLVLNNGISSGLNPLVRMKTFRLGSYSDASSWRSLDRKGSHD
jgi:hypothetical protein